MSPLVNQGFECDEAVAMDDPPPPEMVSGELSLCTNINTELHVFEDTVFTYNNYV